ncbi:MAG: indolepyruvate ferredoxin oxidoreductase subunit alpha [Kiritimatiellae bacterium]|jgi:indolepyruvate ferredoxin oxidoreductase alpha subunit|nr:indolepyruvate ferredoxin oxidoreductase subunit alpha [Kiritimatiellia bacterium]
MSNKMLLSANEAVAYAAYKAGCKVASAYPGTPSTEIFETIARFKDKINADWAVNEKVALEVAIGGSMAGARSLCAMKHVGLNVAMDPLMTYTFIGALGGLVLVVADDPGIHSSQNEQDTRTLARFARVPLFEPSNSQEAFDMIQEAYEVSERYQVPCMVRLTTRTSHTSTVVDLGDDFGPGNVENKPYVKDICKIVSAPVFARPMRYRVQKRTEELRKYSTTETVVNRIEEGDKSLGIITASVAYEYVKEVFGEYAILKLGMSNPFPTDLVRHFCGSVDRVLVVEELDPVMEEQVRAMGLEVVSYETELDMMELNPGRLLALRKELLGDVEIPEATYADKGLPARPPVLCSGCSHRGLFYVLSKLGATVTGDIGCYTLGAFPPLNAMDSVICMGASIGTAFGMEKAGYNKRLCAVIGDSTFFHSGMTGIQNVLYNGGSVTTIVLDNRITGMTGHQVNPGSGKTLAGDVAPVTNIGAVARAMGYKRVESIDAFDIDRLENVLTAELDSDEPSVVIVTGPCRINAGLMQAGTFEVDPEKCKACGGCFKLGCPAIIRGESVADGKRFKAHIDPVQCTGCGFCEQVCKFDAISRIR